MKYRLKRQQKDIYLKKKTTRTITDQQRAGPLKRTKLTESQPDSKKEDSSSEMEEMFPETTDM